MKLKSTYKKIVVVSIVMMTALLFQNCGEETFVSSQGAEVFSSFEDAYPEMETDGLIGAKFEKSRDFYAVSPELDRKYNAVFRALPSRPSPKAGLGSNGGTGLTNSRGSNSRTGSNSVSGDVDQKEPTFIGLDRDFYAEEFNYPAVLELASTIRKNQSKIFPARYYGHPRYEQAFGGDGLGVIGINQNIGAETPAVFYQYKLDYYREKAVIFVITDGLSRGKLGDSSVLAGQSDFVKLAKLGYLVVHLKPKSMRSGILSPDKCENLNQFFFNGVQEVRRAISNLVDKKNYYGIDPEKMFIIGFGEGGTLAATTAFLDQSEAKSRYGVDLAKVNGFEDRSLFKGVTVSGGGLVDKNIIGGDSKTRVVTVHGGNDPNVSVSGDQIYGCQRDASLKIRPIASKPFSDEVTARSGSSASLLHCGKETASDVRPVSTQVGYFATYFHNILASKGFGIDVHYKIKHCRKDKDGDYNYCNYPVPLISQLISLDIGEAVGNYYTQGPCQPK